MSKDNIVEAQVEEVPQQKTIDELTVVELKAALFDMDQQVKQIQSQMQAVAEVLQKKLQK